MNMTGLPAVAMSRLQERIHGGRVLERDPSPEAAFDAKVLVCPDGLIFKFFRVRRFCSSNLISPYARRFSGNARRLNEAGVEAPVVREVFYVSEIRRQVAVYPWIEGVTMREKLGKPDATDGGRDDFQWFGRFMAGLHQKGVSFEGGHLNNYVQKPDGNHALIDVTDVAFFRSALPRSARLKNLSKLSRHPDDAALVIRLGWEPLLEGYQEGLKSLGAGHADVLIGPQDL